MMPSRSAPNLQQTRDSVKQTYPYRHQHQSGLVFTAVGVARDDDSPPPAPPIRDSSAHKSTSSLARELGNEELSPPVRDSSSLKSVKYGVGHEKFPSWPVPAAAESPNRGPPSGSSYRSKSWTDHTNYPKEKVVAYTRPYMRRQHSQYAQQKLKTVMERCEKIPPEIFEPRREKLDRLYLPRVVDQSDYTLSSPPERDIASKPHLTAADLEEYARSCRDPPVKFSFDQKPPIDYMEYEENMLTHLHQKQISYAQSEGYHSYVSSTDSTSTPFLDRLRRDSEAATPRTPPTWDEPSDRETSCRREGRDSVVTTSSGSASSSETLKWHGSMSDVSVASSCAHPPNSSSSSSSTVSRQLIAHSARVQTPQRHHSESVLYMDGEREVWKEKETRKNSVNKLKLFAVNTYTVPEVEKQEINTATNRLSLSLQSALSVADRITELEKQHKYSYYDPEKKHKVPDPTLKAIQKKALLSFYERHHNATWRSEPQLTNSQQTLSVPQSPPKIKTQLPSRRASSASDYNSKRSSLASGFEPKCNETLPRHQHSNSCGSLSNDLLGPVIMGPSISVDDWVPDKPPERPPKNPNLRTAFPDLFQEQRIPSPELPPPSPPTVNETEVYDSDEPLPPPPPECQSDWQREFNDRLKENTSNNQVPGPQVQKTKKEPLKQTVGIPERNARYSLIKTRPGEHIIQQISSKPYQNFSKEKPVRQEQVLGFPSQRGYAERASTRYPTTQKLVLNGSIAVSEKLNGEVCKTEAVPLRRPQFREETHRAQRASITEAPPPLQPRQMRINQSMRGRSGQEQRKGEGMRELRSASLSQSKASYLASRRDRVVPDSETGSYKRTMSPNGHAICTEPINDPPKAKNRETVWPLNKDIVKSTTSLLRRSSLEKQKKEKPPEREEQKRSNLSLPDVLPVNAKIFTGRSPPQHTRPPKLSFRENETPSGRSSPSPPPLRSSPFSPLRTTSLSSSASPPVLDSVASNTSPHSLQRSSPHIKQSLSPSSPMKLSPVRNSPPSSVMVPLTISNGTPEMGSPPRSPKEYPKVVEGLQMIQRTEVVLRVNAATTDAASQTEKEELPPTPLPTRKKLQEEIECEKLSEDFVNHLPTSDRLKDLLVPGPDHKKPTDYVYGLFRVDITSRPRPANSPFRSRNNTPSSSPPPTITTSSSTKNSSSKLSLPATVPLVPSMEPTSPLSGSSIYFTTSEPKAKFLTRYSQDMNQCHVVKNTKDLNQKKDELVSRLDRKLEVLRSEALVVSEECKINDELGENVENHINRLARPHEVAKFRLHVEEVGKITSLLLGLSGRLARVENALMGMPDDRSEKRILESKRDKLLDQLDEAKKLKERIDKRSISVSNILYKYLDSAEYADYDHFINMKAKLIMDSKEISDKIKLGEEQLAALKDTLIVAD